MLLFKISNFQASLMLKLSDIIFLIISKILILEGFSNPLFISFKISYNWRVINRFAYHQPYNQLKIQAGEIRVGEI